MNLPHTVGLYDEKFHLYTDHNGNVKFTNIFKESDVCNTIQKIAVEDYNKKIERDMPAMVLYSNDYTDISDWESYREDCSSSKIDSKCLMQQFIYPFGGKHSLVRFVYYNPV